MNVFFESNPGLKSRFNTFIDFPDYTLSELVDIFIFECRNNDYIPTEKGAFCLSSLKNILYFFILLNSLYILTIKAITNKHSHILLKIS